MCFADRLHVRHYAPEIPEVPWPWSVHPTEYVPAGVARSRRTRSPLWRRRQEGNVAGGEVSAGAVQACGVAPPAGGATSDVDVDLHHQLGTHQRDGQRLPGAPPGRERPAGPGVSGPGRSGPASVLLVAWARVVVRPVYWKDPGASSLALW